jgi:hypothetical protein
MPRLEQYDQHILPSGQASGVRMPSGLFNAEHQSAQTLAGSIDRLGKIAGETAETLLDADMKAERRAYEISINESIAGQKKYMADNTDYNTYQKEFDTRLDAITKTAGGMKYKANQQWAKDYVAAQKPQWQTSVDADIRTRMFDDISATSHKNIDAYANGPVAPEKLIFHGGDEMKARMNDINAAIEENVESGVWTREYGENMRQRSEAQIQKNILVAQKLEAEQNKKMFEDTLLVESVNALGDDYDNIDEAFKTMDQMTNAWVQSGQMTEADAIEYRRSTQNKVADLAEERKAKKAKEEKENSIQITENLTKSILDGTFTADQLETSDLSKEEKEAFRPIAQNLYSEPAEVTDYDASKQVNEAVIAYSLGVTDKKTALTSLLNMRYVTGTITDKTFRDSVARINTKYPPNFAAVLSGVLSSIDAESKTAGSDWFYPSSDKAKTVTVSEAIMDWVDQQIRETKKYPPMEDILKKTKELGIAIKTHNDSIILNQSYQYMDASGEDLSRLSNEELIKRLTDEQ